MICFGLSLSWLDVANPYCQLILTTVILAGLPEGMLLFCLGISIGVMSTILASKREVDELNDLLKQTQNLVQDLHEELEMRDSVTMKELANEACIFREINCPNIKESMDTFPCQAPTGSSTGQVEDESTLLDDKKAHVQEESEKLELMSKIEAELEAELERLELNINTSSPERRLSDLDEVCLYLVLIAYFVRSLLIQSKLKYTCNKTVYLVVVCLSGNFCAATFPWERQGKVGRPFLCYINMHIWCGHFSMKKKQIIF